MSVYRDCHAAGFKHNVMLVCTTECHAGFRIHDVLSGNQFHVNAVRDWRQGCLLRRVCLLVPLLCDDK